MVLQFNALQQVDAYLKFQNEDQEECSNTVKAAVLLNNEVYQKWQQQSLPSKPHEGGCDGVQEVLPDNDAWCTCVCHVMIAN